MTCLEMTSCTLSRLVELTNNIKELKSKIHSDEYVFKLKEKKIGG